MRSQRPRFSCKASFKGSRRARLRHRTRNRDFRAPSGAIIAETEIAMPAFHGSDDDFLFQIQHFTETPSSDTADAFKERLITRIRKGRKRYIMCQAPPISVSWQQRFLRAFNSCWP